MNPLFRFLRDEEGQDLIEYTLLVAFIALASAGIFLDTSPALNSMWTSASNSLSNAAAASS